nr:MAG: very short patch repair endonuclease [Pseudomonadota bacterium]
MEDPAIRSKTMAAVKGKDTEPELVVRRLCHSLGYRYRLHRADLPGKPDLVFPSRRKVIFVHGCFWHGHDCARGSRVPKTNRTYWVAKIGRNRARDERYQQRLRELGWRVLTVWECETKSPGLKRRIVRFLN